MSLDAKYVITDAGDRVPRDVDAERAERVRLLVAETSRAADRAALDPYAGPTSPQESRP